MSDRDDDLRIRPGRIRDRGGGRAKTFVDEVWRAAKRAGHDAGHSSRGKRASGFERSTFGRGRAAFARNRLFAASRRVVVKARVVRHQGRGFRSAPLSAHVACDGEKAHMFNVESDRVDVTAFPERTRDNRHHFRFIVSPEDAGAMTDLKAFARDLGRTTSGSRASKPSNIPLLSAASSRCVGSVAPTTGSRHSCWPDARTSTCRGR